MNLEKRDDSRLRHVEAITYLLEVVCILLVIGCVYLNQQVKHINQEINIATTQKQTMQRQEQIQAQLRQIKTPPPTPANLNVHDDFQAEASRGTTPRHYKYPVSEQVLLTNMTLRKYVGKWRITFYNPSSSQCGSSSGITASGKPVVPGYTIAVDKRYWPFGTKFYIEGLGVGEATDTGSAICGPNSADLCVFSRAYAKKLGVQTRRVWLISE